METISRKQTTLINNQNTTSINNNETIKRDYYDAIIEAKERIEKLKEVKRKMNL